MFEDLYQEIIMDHASRPRNKGRVETPDAVVHADNPLCGDELTLSIRKGEDGAIEDIKFEANACAICMASASMMTVKAKGRTVEEAKELSSEFVRMLTADEETQPERITGELKVLESVRRFPMRVKCATLGWHALEDSLIEASKEQ